MRKILMSLMAGTLGFTLLAGLAMTAQAKDNDSADNPGNGSEIKSANEKPKTTTDDKKHDQEKNRKECQGLGCKMPKCIHDWSQYELNLTPDQQNKVKGLKERINKKTVGMNWCTRTAAQHRLEELRKQKNPSKSEVEKARAELKRIKTGIEAGHKEFNDTFKNQILTAEQAKKFEARQKAEKEHRELCSPKHHPSCPFYRKDNVKNEGRYIKYCQDDSHLSQGIFECPGYKEAKKEQRKEKNDQTEKKGESKK
jgi:Spy/CpxP family protein refolding chaperone